jgi:hypothetical protein
VAGLCFLVGFEITGGLMPVETKSLLVCIGLVTLLVGLIGLLFGDAMFRDLSREGLILRDKKKKATFEQVSFVLG